MVESPFDCSHDDIDECVATVKSVVAGEIAMVRGCGLAAKFKSKGNCESDASGARFGDPAAGYVGEKLRFNVSFSCVALPSASSFLSSFLTQLTQHHNGDNPASRSNRSA